MRETQALIERVRRVSADVLQIELTVESALMHLAPGQSLFVRPTDQADWQPYLREQWIPVAVGPGSVVVEAAPTRFYAPGDALSVLSPLGRPIPLRPQLLHLLLIAEDALPIPFMHLARQVIGGGVEVTLVLRGAARRYPLELLPPEIEVLHGEDDWRWPKQVDMFAWADQVLVVAPPYAYMEVYGHIYATLAQLRHHRVPDGFVFGLFYYPMACGVGACGACLVPSRQRITACTDGPAIDLKQVRFP